MRKDKAFAIAIKIDNGQKKPRTIYVTPRKKDSGFLLKIRMRNLDGVLEHIESIKVYAEVAQNGVVHLGLVTPLERFKRDNIGNLVKSSYDCSPDDAIPDPKCTCDKPQLRCPIHDASFSDEELA